MFISQTLSSLDREIVEQLRISFFGFGLSMGSELRSLTEIIGGSQSAMNLYQSFRDPHSSFDLESRQYSFMTVGPVSPLSFAGTPLFFNALTMWVSFCVLTTWRFTDRCWYVLFCVWTPKDFYFGDGG